MRHLGDARLEKDLQFVNCFSYFMFAILCFSSLIRVDSDMISVHNQRYPYITKEKGFE